MDELSFNEQSAIQAAEIGIDDEAAFDYDDDAGFDY